MLVSDAWSEIGLEGAWGLKQDWCSAARVPGTCLGVGA